jgi:hypothetical protein
VTEGRPKCTFPQLNMLNPSAGSALGRGVL